MARGIVAVTSAQAASRDKGVGMQEVSSEASGGSVARWVTLAAAGVPAARRGQVTAAMGFF